MEQSVLVSTFFLTLLLGIGLWFFIKASVKERTETIRFWIDPDVALLEQFQQYFTNRAYQVSKVDPEQQQMTFSGFVQPSLGLAIFLTFLAGVGLLCLGLVLAILLPTLAILGLGLIVFAPLAGWFYWQRAGRVEEVLLQVESPNAESITRQWIVITGHRDELAEIQKAFTLNLVEEGF